MGTCAEEAVLGLDETYWADDRAALPVLLIDEATEAITAALYRVRCGSELDSRDLAAAGVALRDLFGGLSQLTGLLSATAEKTPADRLETLCGMTESAQLAADGLLRDCTHAAGRTQRPIPRQQVA
ncbi:MAG TPA: hypothetical protein VFO16_02055, partial [Pseudonocardiaceae bacterium]|nr:hypothetical protein [Pseudonocardiaceae bacterium]